jgi:hypothetical protein
MKEILRKAKSIIPFAVLPNCYQMTLVVECQRALVDELGVFLCRHHSTMVLYAHILPGHLSIDSLQKSAMVGLSQVIRQVLRCET